MCGIAGIHRKNGKRIPKLNQLADELLLAIENRGRHGAGYLALMENGKVQLEKRACPASRFVKTRGRMAASAKTVLLHTRWATVGAPDDPRNAHPVAAGTVAAIHNGTIYNATELFTVFGLPRQAEVDSEIIPALINHAGWSQAEHAIDMFDGGAATAIINTDTPDEMILARTTGYPLVVMETDDFLIFASTRVAIESAWRLTFGKPPPGKFYEIGEWKMARVNGTVEHLTIREYTPPKPPKYKKVKGKVGGKPVSKRARKRARKTWQTTVKNGRQAVVRSHEVYEGLETPSQIAARTARADALAEIAMERAYDHADDYTAAAIRDLLVEGFTLEEAWEMVEGPPVWADEVDEEFYASKQLMM